MEYNDENISLSNKDWQDMANEYEKVVKAGESGLDNFFVPLCELCNDLAKCMPQSNNLMELKFFVQSLQPQVGFEIQNKFFAKPQSAINLSIFNLLKSAMDMIKFHRPKIDEKLDKMIDLLLELGMELNSIKNKKW